MLKQQERPPFGRQRRAASADPAITALVEQYAATLYRVAYAVVRNHADAEDAVEEAFLRVLKHRDKLSTIRNKRTWLVKIAWNAAVDKTRRAKARPETEDITDYARVLPVQGRGADEQVIADEGCVRVLALIDKLPAKEREVLTLSAVEELSTDEIALVLKTTPSAVRSRLFRARNLLRTRIEAEAQRSIDCHAA